MSVEEIKTIVRRYCEEIISQGQFDVAEEIIGESLGPERVKDLYIRTRQSFPDVKREIQDIVVENDKAIVYSIYTATHTGSGGVISFAPTGVTVRYPIVATFIVRDGKMVDEIWSCHELDKHVIIPSKPPALPGDS